MVLSLPVVDAVEASASSSQVRAGRSIWLLPARFHHSLCCISFDLFCWFSLTMLAFCRFCAISEHCECPEPSLQTLLSSLFLCPFTTARGNTDAAFSHHHVAYCSAAPDGLQALYCVGEFVLF